jgi:hypothetical protein
MVRRSGKKEKPRLLPLLLVYVQRLIIDIRGFESCVESLCETFGGNLFFIFGNSLYSTRHTCERNSRFAVFCHCI